MEGLLDDHPARRMDVPTILRQTYCLSSTYTTVYNIDGSFIIEFCQAKNVEVQNMMNADEAVMGRYKS